MSVFFMDFDMAPSVIWARDLYEQMQIQSDFRKWFPRMCQYGFVEGRDYEFVPRVRPQDEGGRTVQRYVKDYRITLEMAKQLYKLHVNEKTSEIAAQVGRTPQNWNSSVFSMIQNLSESVVVPIAGIIITLVLCYELISMLTERNNLHDVDT